MKKILCFLAVASVCLAACSNKNTKAENSASVAPQADTTLAYVNGRDNSQKDAKYQIIDQEFDNLLAPDTDYDTLCAYELQACGAAYLPPAAKLQDLGQVKAAAKKADISKDVKSTRAKKVVNTTNIYYVDGPNPNVPASSTTTTTTTYTNGQSSTTTTSSSGAASSSSSTTTTSGYPY